MKVSAANERIWTFGMVGGGRGAFIGDVHRKAALFDARVRLAAGCFSRDFENTRATGRALAISEDRLYRDYKTMVKAESARRDPVDFVIIVTPNDSHFEIAREFLNAGIHVVCDKPLTIRSEDAVELARLAKARDLLCMVTHANAGYPLVKQARAMIAEGSIGRVRMVMAEYAQEWLAVRNEDESAIWRLDPKRQGISGSVGDIGCHINHTVSYMTGLRTSQLLADLTVFGEGRLLDNNGSILLRYRDGAIGHYWCSQIAIGSCNALRIRVFGETGSIEWHQERPDELVMSMVGEPSCVLRRGRDKLHPSAQKYCRIPPGHPEGTYEAFANLYSAFLDALASRHSGGEAPEAVDRPAQRFDYPDAWDGVSGVRFIEQCVLSSGSGTWVDADTTEVRT